MQLVSIIVPAYNAEKWIAEAVRSALAQDWPRKELIIVDDGSTDDTLRVAKTFESGNVRVVTQPNRGASAARNRGLSLAQGDYIQWLDADDLLAPDKVTHQMRYAEPGVTSRVLLSGAYGEFYANPLKAIFAPHALWADRDPLEFLLIKFTQNVWLNPAAWLVSRRLTDLAGPWDERLSLDDDGEYFTRVVASAERVKFVPQSLCYYRRAEAGSLSRGVSQRACESLLLSLTLCTQHLLALERSSRTKAAAIKLLNVWVRLSDCFHPDRGDLLSRAQELARNLDGRLGSPRVNWKYQPIKALFGWKGARRARGIMLKMKLLARVQYERFAQWPWK